MEVSACMPQFMKLYDDMVILAGQNLTTKVHSHHAVKIVISFDSSCTAMTADETVSDRGVLLHHDVSHAVKADGCSIFIYIDPETLLGRRLDHVLGTNTVLVINSMMADQIRTYLSDLATHQYSDTEVATYLTSVLVKGIVEVGKNYTSDVRISNVTRYIKANLDKRFNIHELKEIACLSESRLLHLFKKEIGIPIRKYVLGWRLRLAIKLYLTGRTITQSAHFAGFADVAHLTRTFVSMFGLNPSQVLKNFN